MKAHAVWLLTKLGLMAPPKLAMPAVPRCVDFPEWTVDPVPAPTLANRYMPDLVIELATTGEVLCYCDACQSAYVESTGDATIEPRYVRRSESSGAERMGEQPHIGLGVFGRFKDETPPLPSEDELAGMRYRAGMRNR